MNGSPESGDEDELEVGELLGNYRIERQLGHGGMGAVYLARHDRLGREAALKVVARSLTVSGEETFQRKFHEEGGLMASLEHEHIVRVFDAGESHGRYYLAMEYLAGGDLEERKRTCGGRLPPAEVAGYLEQLLDALIYAHGKDIVHRDLKPANLLLSEKGTIKVCDFGLARVVGDTFEQSVIERSHLASRVGDARTRLGSVGTGDRSGTLYYMAPEVLKGNPADARSDLYAVGVIAYYLLTGDKPIGAYKPASAIVKGLDRGWDKWLNKVLQSEPDDRTPSARDALHGLSRLRRTLRGVKAPASPASNASKVAGWSAAAVATMVLTYFVLPEETGVFHAEIENPGLQDDERLEIVVDRREGRSTPRVLGNLISFGPGEKLRNRLRRPFPERAVSSADGGLRKEVPAGTRRVLLRHPYHVPLSIDLEVDSRGFVSETVELVRGTGRLEMRFAMAESDLDLFKTEGGPVIRVNGQPMDGWWREESLFVDSFPAGRGEVELDHPFFEVKSFTYDIETYEVQVADVEPARSTGSVSLDLDPSDTGWRVEDDQEVVEEGTGPGRIDLPAGSFVFVASRRGFETPPRSFVLERGDELAFEESLFGDIALEFVNERLLGDENLNVALEGSSIDYVWDGPTVRLSEIPAGECELVLTHPNYETRSLTLNVSADRETDYALELSRGEGRVEVITVPESLEWVLEHAEGEADRVVGAGDWTGSLPTGEYVLGGELDGYEPVEKELTVNLNEDHPIALETVRSKGAIDIAITNLEAGHDVQQVDLRVGGREREWTRRDGLFRVNGVAAGEHEISAAHPRVGQSTAMTTVEHNETASVELTLGQVDPVILEMPSFSLEHGASVVAVAWAPNGVRLATCGADGVVRLWNVVNREEITRIDGHVGRVTSAAFSPDGDRLLTGGEDGTVRVWDAASGESVRDLEWTGGGVTSVAFSPGTENLALAGGERGILRLWRVAEGEVLLDLEGHEGGINSIAFSPCGEKALSGAHDRTARLWRLATGEESTPTFEHRRLGVNAVAFSADGERILTGVNDNTARLWRAETREELRVFLGHEHSVQSVDFSSEGQRILTTGGWDGTTRVWNANMGWELYRIKTNGRFLCAAFSPDRRSMVVTGNADGEAAIWLLDER